MDLVTQILKLDLDMVKMYFHTKNKVSMSRHSNVITQPDRQAEKQTHTDRQYENMTSTYPGGTDGLLDLTEPY